MSDLGNQHNNGPHQDQIFDNPAALCLALRERKKEEKKEKKKRKKSAPEGTGSLLRE